MKRKIILSLAMSMDGFIATENGGYEWIAGDGDDALNTSNKWNYHNFLEQIDTIVMGKKCYLQGMHNDFPDKEIFVATTEKIDDYKNIHFISGNIVEKIKRINVKSKKHIFLFGGGGLINNFLQSDAIDEYFIGIVPILLGSGRPLFHSGFPTILLKLREVMIEDGIVVLHYERRNKIRNKV
jgi:dihydrofolate reductase